jgi:hypothetical protein
MSTHVQSPPPRKQSLVPSLDGSTIYSRRPSAANGFVDALRKASVASAAPSITPSQDDEINPEELFVKHTVAEVRGIQKKLQYVTGSYIDRMLTLRPLDMKLMQNKESCVSWLGT